MKFARIKLADGTIRRLNRERFTVGRADDNDLIIIDAEGSLSRWHASLVFKGDSWYIEDLGSKNHTFVGGTVIAPNSLVELPACCSLHFGMIQVEFSIDNVSASVPTQDATISLDAHSQEKIRQVISGMDRPPVTQPPPSPASTLSLPGRAPKAPSPEPKQVAPNRVEFAGAYGVLESRSVAGRKFPITRVKTRIGTDPRKCDIVLDDQRVDLEHADILFENGKVKIVDLGTKDGTRVNDSKHKRWSYIVDGDKVSMGNSSFTFRLLMIPPAVTPKKSRTMALPILALLSVCLLGGGTYYLIFIHEGNALREYYEGLTGLPEPVEAGVPPPIVNSGESQMIQEVTSRVREQNFADASARIDAYLAQNASHGSERGEQLRSELALLNNADRQFKSGNMATAYRTIVRLDSSAILFAASTDFASRIEKSLNDAIGKLRQGARDAEAQGDWLVALQSLRELHELLNESGKTDGESSLAIALSRVETKSLLDESYKSNHRDLERSPETVRNRIERTISDAEKRIGTSPGLNAEVQSYMQRLIDLHSHASFLLIYREFNGGYEELEAMLEISSDPAKLSDRYEGKSSVTAMQTRASRIAALFDEIHENAESVRQGSADAIRGLIGKLNEFMMLAEPTMPVHKTALEWKTVLEESFTAKLQEQLDKACKGAGVVTGSKAQIEGSISCREQLYSIIMVFTSDERRAASRQDTLRAAITNHQQAEILSRALSLYNEELRQASTLLRKAKSGRDPAIEPKYRIYLDQLDKSTYPEDDQSKDTVALLRAEGWN